MKILQKISWKLTLLGLIATLGACGGGGGTGTMSVGLTDGPTEDYSAVYVTIVDVQVHRNGPGEDDEGGWTSFSGPINRTINLLDLTDGVVEALSQGPLEAGSYSQIRLIIGTTPDALPNLQCHSHPFANYVIDADDGEIHELKVPSGENTGLKIICAGNCVIAADQTTEIILDFDAAASVVVAGSSGNYNLKPTIKLLETEDFTLITGRVFQPGGVTGLAGAVVSAQIFNPLAAIPEDAVIVQTSTLTDVNGDYQLFLRPGDYNLVVSSPGFETAAVNFSALPGQTPVQDFILVAAPTGSLGGIVTITGVDADTFAHLSVEQDLSVEGLPEVVEVDALDVRNGTAYSTELSVGDYDVLASTCGFASQAAPVSITADTTSTLDFNF